MVIMDYQEYGEKTGNKFSESHNQTNFLSFERKVFAPTKPMDKNIGRGGTKTGKTGCIDHPSPACSEQSVLLKSSKSLNIDIETLTFRDWVVSNFRIGWSQNSGERCSLSPDFAVRLFNW